MKKIFIVIVCLWICMIFCGCHMENQPRTDYDDFYEDHIIVDDETALAFADQLITNLDDSFRFEDYPEDDVCFDSEKHCYIVSRSSDAQNGYSVELWVCERGKLSVENLYIGYQQIDSLFITNEHEAKLLGDIILSSTYKQRLSMDIIDTYPDLTVYTDDDKEWVVTRNDGGFDSVGACMSIKVCSDGSLYDLCWGGE